jgi:hypothetical protein
MFEDKRNEERERVLRKLLADSASNAPPEAPSPFFRARLAAAVESARRSPVEEGASVGLAARRMLPAFSVVGALLVGASLYQSIQTSREREIAVKAALSPERSGELVLLASFLGEAP